MNRRQKIVQQRFLGNEEAVIKRLDQVYGKSLDDLTKRVAELDSSIDTLRKAYESVTDDEIGELAAAFLKKNQHLTPKEARETLQSMIQSKVYQKDYQNALKKQVGDILDTMHKEEFKTVSEYLDKCYEEGFIGTMYDLQGQGIPMCFPLDQEAMVTAVQLDSKISHGLYTRLGEDVAMLKKKITAQVSRGVATGMTFQQVAQQLAGYTNIGYNNAIRIARTEGHRIQCQSGMDACHKAKEKGAYVVKQWDSTLDGRTRDSHAAVDGEIRELEEKFSNNLEFPGDPHGKAAEVINCRCALLQRARWAIGGGFTKMNNFTKELETFDSPEAYDEFKKAFFSKENKRYMDYVGQMEEKYGTKNFEKVLGSMTDREYKHYSGLLAGNPLFNKKAAETLTNNPNNDILSLVNFTQFDDGNIANNFFYYDDEKRGLMAKRNSEYGKWRSGLSEDSKAALYSYTADGYGDVNDYLRKVNGWDSIDSARVEDQIKQIDSAISSFNLKDNIVVQRGAGEVSLDSLFENSGGINELTELIGHKYHDDGFMSSTVLMGNPVAITKPVVFDISIPAGKGRGAYINEFGSQFQDAEYEFLIKRGATFTVTDISEDADLGKIYVKMVMDVE